MTFQLEPADYWKLRALLTALQAAREKAAKLVAPHAQAHDAHVKVLAEKYAGLALDNGSYRLDDETCTLVRTETSP